MYKRRRSSPIRIKRRERSHRRTGTSYPPVTSPPRGKTTRSPEVDEFELWFRTAIVRYYRTSSFEMVKNIVKIYKERGYNIEKEYKHFKNVIARNVLYQLHLGRDYFNSKSGWQYDSTSLIREYDLAWFNFNHQTPNITKDSLCFEERFYRQKPVRKHRLSVNRVFQNGTYIYSEYKDSFLLSQKQYNHLRLLYRGKPAYFDQYVFMMGLRYKSLASTKFLATLPSQIVSKLGWTEATVTPFTATGNRYYSYWEDEAIFASRGNFIKSEIPAGKYIVQPYLDVPYIFKCYHKAIQLLESGRDYSFLLLIPHYHNFGDPKYNINYRELATKSYYRWDIFLKSQDYQHYDHYSDHSFELYNSHLMLLSNRQVDVTAEQIMATWQKATKTSKLKV